MGSQCPRLDVYIMMDDHPWVLGPLGGQNVPALSLWLLAKSACRQTVPALAASVAFAEPHGTNNVLVKFNSAAMLFSKQNIPLKHNLRCPKEQGILSGHQPTQLPEVVVMAFGTIRPTRPLNSSISSLSYHCYINTSLTRSWTLDICWNVFLTFTLHCFNISVRFICIY